MLELEVVPERSLGCEQWEFILGESLHLSFVCFGFRNYCFSALFVKCILPICIYYLFFNVARNKAASSR